MTNLLKLKAKMIMKTLFSFILTICISTQFTYSQNWDINLLKSINGQYTEPVGKPMIVVTESITPVALGATVTTVNGLTLTILQNILVVVHLLFLQDIQVQHLT